VRLMDPTAQRLFTSHFYESPMPQAIITRDGIIQEVNQALGELLGRPVQDLAGMRPRELRHPSDRGGADAVIAAVLAGEQPSGQGERIYAHASGEPVPVLIHLSVISTDEGDVDGLIVHVQDLRVLRQSERRLELQEQFYAALGQRAREFAHVLDADGRFAYVSPAVTPMFGYDPSELLGRDAYAQVHPSDVRGARADLDAVVADGGTRVGRFRLTTADGQWRWVENTMTNLLHSPVAGIVCNLIDVTERREAEVQLRVAQLRNQAIVETSREGIWVIAPDGRTDFANARLADILGWSPGDLDLTVPGDLVSAEDALMLRTGLRERWERGEERFELDYEHPDRGTRRLSVVASPFAFGEGAFHGSLAMISDITEQRRMEEELRHAALHDPLTGLPNRVLLGDRLEQALLRQNEQGHDVTLLLVDLDHFKLVNDTRGHEIGDQVLVVIAQRLMATVRPHETVARLGGDEFVVLCTCDHDVTSSDLSERIRAALAEPIVLGQHRVRLTASIGVASAPPHEGAHLLRYADAAMFAAKSAGRAQVRSFDRSLAEESERAYALADDLRTALEGDALDMHYQPVVDLTTGDVIGYEALARWDHPEQGPVSPGAFVPLAEQLGLTRQLDRWAVSRSTSDLARLRSRGAVPPGSRVAVNLSAQHLADPDLEQHLLTAVSATRLSPEDVGLEITEGAVMRDVETTKLVLHRLRDRGFRIAIDDFGTGHSSLAYLRNFPISTLKIDRSFVMDMTVDDDLLAIVASIIQLARAIGVDTVAEGVETAEQARRLRELGCTAGQGWLWSKAVPAADLDSSPRQFAVPAAATAPSPGRRRSRVQTELRDEHGLSRMLQLQAEGASLFTIAAALNNEGYRKPDGQRWHKISVAHALRDVAYPTVAPGP